MPLAPAGGLSRFIVPATRGHLDLAIEAEPPSLRQHGIKLRRNTVHKTFSGETVGRFEAQIDPALPPDQGGRGNHGGGPTAGTVRARSKRTRTAEPDLHLRGPLPQPAAELRRPRRWSVSGRPWSPTGQDSNTWSEMMEAPWLLPIQNVTGSVESST